MNTLISLYGFAKGFDLRSQVNNTYDTSVSSANKLQMLLIFLKTIIYFYNVPLK